MKKEKKHKGLNIFTGFILGMYLVVSGYLIYNLYMLTDIENLIRYAAMIGLGILDIFLIIRYFVMRKKAKVIKYIVMILVLIILGGVQFFISYSLGKGLNLIDNISRKDTKVYKTSLIALKSSNLTKVSDITDDTKIGMVSDEEDVENNILAKELQEKDKISDKSIKDYEDPVTMLYELYEGKINAAFISGGYIDLYKGMQKFEHIADDVVEIDKYSKKMKVKESSGSKASTKSITEPFTLLLLGVDSEEEDISNAFGLGDSIMVITFNPKTLNATVFSIPRDTFVPISCYRNVRSKITHAASGGDSCMINTIQNFLDVHIDYYAKVNFRGLIKIVDSLGGIDVEVPYSFCESDESRSYDNTIYVEKGLRHLNGKEALALSRNRHTNEFCGSFWNQGERSDFVRGQNQQLVINAIVNKVKSMSSIDQLYSLLDAVGGSMTTNMDRNQILSFYNIFKRILLYSEDLTSGNNIIDMQKLYLNGSGALIQDGIMSGMNLYEYVPSTESLNAIINAMKENLELKDVEPSYSFSFSADKEYEQKVIGKDLYGGIASYPSIDDSGSGTEQSSGSCSGENEEMGADGVTCVCKNGYEKVSGVCTKKADKDEAECGTNEELGADKQTCVCKPGYEKQDGVCVEESSTTDTPTLDPTTDPTPNPTPNPEPTTPDTPSDNTGGN